MSSFPVSAELRQSNYLRHLFGEKLRGFIQHFDGFFQRFPVSAKSCASKTLNILPLIIPVTASMFSQVI